MNHMEAVFILALHWRKLGLKHVFILSVFAAIVCTRPTGRCGSRLVFTRDST